MAAWKKARLNSQGASLVAIRHVVSENPCTLFRIAFCDDYLRLPTGAAEVKLACTVFRGLLGVCFWRGVRTAI